MDWRIPQPTVAPTDMQLKHPLAFSRSFLFLFVLFFCFAFVSSLHFALLCLASSDGRSDKLTGGRSFFVEVTVGLVHIPALPLFTCSNIVSEHLQQTNQLHPRALTVENAGSSESAATTASEGYAKLVRIARQPQSSSLQEAGRAIVHSYPLHS